MAIIFDAAFESHTGATGSADEGSFQWQHTPTGTPHGILIFIANLDASTSTTISVTYGGVNVPAVSGGVALDSAGEVGRCSSYFLGEGIPTGEQTVVINRNVTAAEMWAVSITVNADTTGATEVTGVTLVQGDGTLAVVAVDDGSPGTNSMRFAAGMSGLNAVPGVGAGTTALFDFDTGNQVAMVARETTVGQGSRSLGWTSGTSDDRAFVYLAVKEKKIFRGFSQARAKIAASTRNFGQANAQIKQTYNRFAQAQARIGRGYGFGQAQAFLPLPAASGTVIVYPNANTAVTNGGWDSPQNAYADDGVVTLYPEQAGVRETDYFFPNIGTGYIPDGSTIDAVRIRVQIIDAIGTFAGIRGYLDGSTAGVRVDSSGNGAEEIVFTYPGTVTLADLRAASTDLKARLFGDEPSQDDYVWVDYVRLEIDYSGAQQAHKAYAQAQAQIKQTYNAFAQSQADILQIYQGYSQSQAQIKQTYNNFAQAQTSINTVYQGYGQAQARILQTYNSFAQAQARMIGIEEGYAQAAAYISGQKVLRDTFTRSESGTWGTPDVGPDWVNFFYTNISVTGTKGRWTVNSPASDVGVGQLGLELGNHEVFYDFSINELPTDPGDRHNFYHYSRIYANYDGYIGVETQIFSTGETIVFVAGASDGTTLAPDSIDLEIVITPNTSYRFKYKIIDASDGNKVLVFFKLWDISTSEPEWKSVTLNFENLRKITKGYYETYYSYVGAGSHSVVVDFDNYNIQETNLAGYAQASALIKQTYQGFAQAQAKIKQTYNFCAQAQATVLRGYAAQVNNSKPIAWWRVGEPSGLFQDFIGTADVDAIVGTPTYGISHVLGDDVDTAISVTGSASYLRIANNVGLDVGAGPVSVEVWVKRSVIGNVTTYQIFGRGGNGYSVGFQANTDKFYLAKQGVGTIATESSTTTDTGWHYFVATWDGATAHIYKDGVDHTTFVGSQTLTNPSATSYIAGNGGTLGYEGALDELAIYNTTLSESTVAAHYVAGAHLQYGQAQAEIVTGVTVVQTYAQAQAQIKQIYNAFAQSQAQVKQIYIGAAQAQASVKSTSNTFAQAQADIKQIYRSFAQAQAGIKKTYNSFAQAQARILRIYNSFAQAQTDIKQTYNSFSQTQSNIKQTYRGYSQAQAQIKTSYTVFAQTQANILQIYRGYAQAQARIQQTYNAFSQAQADIKAVGYGFSQAHAQMLAFGANRFAQALANIKGIDLEGVAQAQAKINTFGINKFAQSQTTIKATYYGFSQNQAQIIQTYQQYAQAQADILQVYQGYAQTQARILAISNSFGQTQASIKQTYNGYAQAQTLIKTTYLSFAQSQANILTTYQSYAQAQADILVTYQVYAQNQARILQIYNSFAQAEAWIEDTYQTYAQTQGSILTSYQSHAEAQAQIKQTYNGYAQANADILQTYQSYAQAQADILVTYYGFAQAQSSILSIYNGSAQAQASILAIGYGFAQSQAKINAFGVQQFAQAQSNIAGTTFPSGQAQAYVLAFGVNSFGQAQTWILAVINNHGQAEGSIKQTYNGYGQSQADILVTYNAFAQAQAQIKQTYQGYANAQASILSTYQGYAQAESSIEQTYNGFGQATADIKQTYQEYGQSQASILTTYFAFAQAIAWIESVTSDFAQAQGQINQTYQVYGNARGQIKQTYLGFAQAQGTILTTYNGFAQAQACVKGNAFGQAQGFILAGRHGHGQAQAEIAAAIHNESGQAQGTILATQNKFGQANADILVTTNKYAQAQSSIEQTYQSHANTQGYVKRLEQGYAQVQGTVLATYNRYGQAQADILATANVYAQAQGRIKQIYQTYAQVQALVNRASQGYAQAQSTINTFYKVFANAQGDILTTTNVGANAQALIVTTVIVNAQAQATIASKYGFAQARAYIRVLHTIKSIKSADKASLNVSLIDKLHITSTATNKALESVAIDHRRIRIQSRDRV